MSEIGMLFVVSLIMWQLIDWLKPNWESLSWAKELTMCVAFVLAVALTITFKFDLFVALEISEFHSVIGTIFAALSLCAGSGFINEISKKIKGVK